MSFNNFYKKNIVTKRKLFQHPWKYKEGVLISILLIIIGLVLGLLTKKPINSPAFPTNLSLIVTYTLLLFAIYKFEHKRQIVQWLSGIPAAISSTVLFAFLAALLGFIPQVSTGMVMNDSLLYNLGLTHLTTSWIFAFGYIFFVTTLGFATVKNFMPIKKKRIGVLLSHVGLYVIILAGIAGDGDIKRTYFILQNNGEPTDIVKDFNSETRYNTPFKLELNKFDIKEYNPKIVLVDAKTGNIIKQNNSRNFSAKNNAEADFKEWKIKVVDFLYSSAPADSFYASFNETDTLGSLPSAFVEIYDKNNKLINKDWITCGNFVWFRKNIYVNKNYYFAMLSPEPKEYSSDVTAYLPEGKKETFILKVNSPKTIMGWKLYQTGYDDTKGRWSNYSVIEAGRDPWLPVVFTGIFLLIGGAFYLFWLGGKSIEEEVEEEVDHN